MGLAYEGLRDSVQAAKAYVRIDQKSRYSCAARLRESQLLIAGTNQTDEAIKNWKIVLYPRTPFQKYI